MITKDQITIINTAAKSTHKLLCKFSTEAISLDEVTRIYELEYKLYLLSQRKSLSDRANIEKLKMEGALDTLLNKALSISNNIFDDWIKIHDQYNVFSNDLILAVKKRVETLTKYPENYDIKTAEELEKAIKEEIDATMKEVEDLETAFLGVKETSELLKGNLL